MCMTKRRALGVNGGEDRLKIRDDALHRSVKIP